MNVVEIRDIGPIHLNGKPPLLSRMDFGRDWIVEDYLASITQPEIPGNGSIDVHRLLERLRVEPTNLHDMYCLGKGYMCLNDWAKAEKWMKRRSECGDVGEERWHAHYMMAVCQGRSGKIEHFICNCLEAYQIRPTRAEPLYWLARYYRESKRYETAFSVCQMGIKVPVPVGDALFVEQVVYQWGFADELAVAGNYCSGENYQKGKAACMHLAMNCPIEDIKDRAKKNLICYS